MYYPDVQHLKAVILKHLASGKMAGSSGSKHTPQPPDIHGFFIYVDNMSLSEI